MELLIFSFIVISVIGSIASYILQEWKMRDYHQTLHHLLKDSNEFSRQQKVPH